jgi:hypothetical protein
MDVLVSGGRSSDAFEIQLAAKNDSLSFNVAKNRSTVAEKFRGFRSTQRRFDTEKPTLLCKST